LRRRQGQAPRDELGREPRQAVRLSQTVEFSVDLLLAVLPFAGFRHPALGVSLLQSAVKSRGFSSRIRYFNLDLVELIGARPYTHIDQELAPYFLAGEWFFADCAFGTEIPDARDYLQKVLASFSAPEGYVAELLRLRGCRTEFIERCVYEILAVRPRVVGFTTTFHQTCACLAVASRLKQAADPPTIILGGANCEAEMGLQMLRSFPFVDYVCTGEGDAAFPEFLERLLRGGDPNSVPGIVPRRGGDAPSRPAMIRDLDALPIPDFSDYFDQLAGLSIAGAIEPDLVFESSRGCWFGAKSHCTFCGLNSSTMTYRSKSPQRVIDELRTLAQTYRRRRCISVDNILDLRYIRELFPRLSDSGLALDLAYETKANLTYEQLRVLKEGGVFALQPGIESFSNEVLRLMRKGCTGLQNIQFLRYCEELGIHALWNFIYGFPGERPEEYERQAELIPLLEHLQPPMHAGPFRLDRFSPMFTHAEQFGLVGVRPSFAYYYVFPLGRTELEGLAYYFDFDYLDKRDPESYTIRARDAIIPWTRRHHRAPEEAPRLDLWRRGDGLIVRDTRPCAVAAEHNLDGLAAEVYLLADSARGFRGLCRELAGGGDEATVRATLEELRAAKLLVEMDGQYLSLAVWRDRAARPAPEEGHGNLSVLEAPAAQPLLHPV
jgi:ribosomal peptide maturation radical SAM protein 1